MNLQQNIELTFVKKAAERKVVTDGGSLKTAEAAVPVGIVLPLAEGDRWRAWRDSNPPTYRFEVSGSAIINKLQTITSDSSASQFP